MHSIFIILTFIAFLIYFVSTILASLSVVVRKFWKKIEFTSFEIGWLMVFLSVFIPSPSSFSGVIEIIVLLVFIIVNFFWFIPLIYYYEQRIKNRLSLYFYCSLLLMIAVSAISYGGWYDIFLQSSWMPISDVIRGITMGFSLIYCGYLTYNVDQPLTQERQFEYYALFGIGTGSFLHGIYHIFVYTFDSLHEFDEIAASSESVGVYFAIVMELGTFVIMGFGFIMLLLNTIKNSSYRPKIETGGTQIPS